MSETAIQGSEKDNPSAQLREPLFHGQNHSVVMCFSAIPSKLGEQLAREFV